MVAKIEIEFPYRLEELSTQIEVEVDYQGKEYGYETKILKNSTIFLVTTSIENSNQELSKDEKWKICERAIDLINNTIYQFRAMFHENIEFQLISPRTVNKIRFEIQDGDKISTEYFSLNQNMPKYFKDFYDTLNVNIDVVPISEMVGSEQAIFLTLIVDAYYSLYEGKYNECIIHCCTATEALIFNSLTDWLRQQLFHKNQKSAERILMEIPMSMKYELLFGSAEKEYLFNQEELLELMKRINKIRNSIIHRGHKATKGEAEMSLNYSSKLIDIIFHKIENLE